VMKCCEWQQKERGVQKYLLLRFLACIYKSLSHYLLRSLPSSLSIFLRSSLRYV
jgi:hypothetical protein